VSLAPFKVDLPAPLRSLRRLCHVRKHYNKWFSKSPFSTIIPLPTCSGDQKWEYLKEIFRVRNIKRHTKPEQSSTMNVPALVFLQYYLLGRKSMKSVRISLTFRRNILLRSSGLKVVSSTYPEKGRRFVCRQLLAGYMVGSVSNHKNRSSVFLRNIWETLAHCTALQHRNLFCSQARLWRPRIQ
jgi:hypothetical protein